MMADEVLVDASLLQAFVARLFIGVGVSPGDARFMAQCLVQTSLWGKDSHGVMRAPHYVSRLRTGSMNPQPRTRIVRGANALEVVDGDNGPGFLVARDAMRRAVQLAGQFGVAAVGARNSSHFGAAALYARMAVDHGMIGIVMTNTAPKVVAPGGIKAITGSNPLAVGVPTHGDFPFLLDIALSAVAGGKLLVASEKGEKIPLNLALDREGRPTDDPGAAFAGSWLPMGGVKGLGLSFAVDILAGLITGGAFGSGVKSQYSNPDEPSGTGHMMFAINVEAIMPREQLAERMSAFVSAIKDSSQCDEGAEVMVPGERAYRTERDRRTFGIPLAVKLYRHLLSLGSQMGLADQDLPARTEADVERRQPR
jgi:L-2-hydroxycarboxylate dehydrogenase (NAD+)